MVSDALAPEGAGASETTTKFDNGQKMCNVPRYTVHVCNWYYVDYMKYDECTEPVYMENLCGIKRVNTLIYSSAVIVGSSTQVKLGENIYW